MKELFQKKLAFVKSANVPSMKGNISIGMSISVELLAKTVTTHFLENLCGRDSKRLLMALTQNFHVISVRETLRKM